jgi:D-alanyl-D-alanine carboxypeptidase
MISSDRARPKWSGRRLLIACLVGIAGVACLAPPALAAKTPNEQTAKLQRALDQVVAAGAPGAAVLIRDGDRTIRLSSGYGNLAPKTAMRVADRTRIGGVTKSFTATVLLQLVREKKLALSDTLEQWLPGVISNGDAITIRQLLNHTSGIFDLSKDKRVLAPYLKGDLTHVLDPRAGVQIAAEHGPLFAPGSHVSYSNTNYFLLAMIAEKATGKSFASELGRRIFKPLGLHQTSYPTASRINGSYTHGYIPLDKGPFDVTPARPKPTGLLRDPASPVES